MLGPRCRTHSATMVGASMQETPASPSSGKRSDCQPMCISTSSCTAWICCAASSVRSVKPSFTVFRRSSKSMAACSSSCLSTFWLSTECSSWTCARTAVRPPNCSSITRPSTFFCSMDSNSSSCALRAPKSWVWRSKSRPSAFCWTTPSKWLNPALMAASSGTRSSLSWSFCISARSSNCTWRPTQASSPLCSWSSRASTFWRTAAVTCSSCWPKEASWRPCSSKCWPSASSKNAAQPSMPAELAATSSFVTPLRW
mmetsp:Transcript_80781/g.213076  ORF Transcript_80781/g.213076 Transcript_80781/m.213076 type:complete len:256 (-) Transcript_80781:1278-2045(-)